MLASDRHKFESEESSDNGEVLLRLLESIERDGQLTQRAYAHDVGVALGLINAYLKRCARKGLIKIKRVPTKRYSYYLTPQGFSEKSRLTLYYLSLSLRFFRHAQRDCDLILDHAIKNGWKRIALIGASDLAEIALICTSRRAVSIIGIVANTANDGRFDYPYLTEQQALAEKPDCIILATSENSEMVARHWVRELGRDRVLAPALLGLAEIGAPINSNAH